MEAAQGGVAGEHPSTGLCVIGVTGTNGKTTVTHLIGEVLRAAGHHPFVLGTLNSGSRELSTPPAGEIRRAMDAHLTVGGTHFVMEVTSEGIDQGRIAEVDFDVKLLTNITEDHLDYHKTFDAYKRVKLGFMAEGGAYKIHPEEFRRARLDFTPSLVGHFNLLNVQAAVSVLRLLAVPERHIRGVLSSCSPPEGRMECVTGRQGPRVYIDYAHTPDALASALGAARSVATRQSGRLLALFGCGGNRCTEKRPKMGEIAVRLADHVVITDDNPRDEASDRIIGDILAGIPPGHGNYVVIPDRREAIREIVRLARPGDVVLLAGKGHERYQIVRGEAHYFNEREEVQRALASGPAAPAAR